MFNSRRAHVPNLTLLTTRSRRHFKKLAGQNNHFLITILIGLNAVEKIEVDRAPEFSTSWNPKDPKISARRSREYSQRSLLSWTTDAVDAYIRDVGGELPGSIPNAMYKEIDGNGKQKDVGLGERIGKLGREHSVDAINTAMVELSIVWRNRIVHSRGTNKLSAATSSILRKNDDVIAERFQGLDIARALSAVKGTPPANPSFKETTSMVRAAQLFIQDLDASILSRVDLDEHLRRTIGDYLTEDAANAKARAGNLWTRRPEKIVTAIAQIAQNFGGFVPSEDDTNRSVSPAFLEELSTLRPREGLLFVIPSYIDDATA